MAELEPNKVIKDYVSNGGPTDWKHKQAAAELYEVAGVLNYYLFSPDSQIDAALPQPLIAIAPHDKRVLGWFRLVPNSAGLPYEIGLNEHWITRPKWELAETICHELVHLYDQEVLGYHAKTGYHRKEFVESAEEIGLHPKLGEGYHLKPADGQFARLMVRLGIDKPESAKSLPTGVEGGIALPPGARNWFDFDRGRTTGGRVRGESTLKKWVCECSPPQKARVGAKRFLAVCPCCKSSFTLQL